MWFSLGTVGIVCGYLHAAEIQPASTILLASKLGAALNSDLMKGGGTDDSAVLQRALDRAAHGKPVHLILDGPALVAGLNIHGNTTIECTAGGGLFLKDGVRRDIIRNAERSKDAIVDRHIVIRGCFLNGNRAHQINPAPIDTNHQNQEPDGTMVAGIQLLGVQDVVLEKLTLWSVRAFGILVGNASDIVARDIRVDNGGPRFDLSWTAEQQHQNLHEYINTDGIHLFGNTHRMVVDGFTGHTGDDAIGICANDGFVPEDATGHHDMGPYVVDGPISDILISNVVLDDAAFGIRLLSSTKPIDRVAVRGVTGTVRFRTIYVSHWIYAGAPGHVGSAEFSDFDVQTLPVAPTRQLLASHHLSEGQLASADLELLPMISVNGAADYLVFRNIVTHVSDGRPLVELGADTSIKALEVQLQVDDRGFRSVPIQLLHGAHVGQLSENIRWIGGIPPAGTQAIINQGGTIDHAR